MRLAFMFGKCLTVSPTRTIQERYFSVFPLQQYYRTTAELVNHKHVRGERYDYFNTQKGECLIKHPLSLLTLSVNTNGTTLVDEDKLRRSCP